ncbi:MAG: hypothetical protein LBK95_17340 [Bifidobacteriaceae bacterium]|nr:hypothetical protein [Bifidobacteriaceae bacterium]
MSGERPDHSGHEDSAPDFDARWQELAAELGQSLPADLQEWAAGQSPDDRRPSAQSPANRSSAGSNHVVWSGGPDGNGLTDHDDQTDDSDWSADLHELGQLERSLDSGADTPLYGPRDWSPAGADEHFEPPEPPPALGGDPMVVLGWIGLIGGLVVVFAWAMAGALVPVWLARGGLVAIVAGTAALIWKMPHRRDPEDRDDGARV